MVLRPVSDPRVVSRDGAALLGIDANCHEPLSQGGLPLRAIWHNEDYAFWLDADDVLDPPQRVKLHGAARQLAARGRGHLYGPLLSAIRGRTAMAGRRWWTISGCFRCGRACAGPMRCTSRSCRHCGGRMYRCGGLMSTSGTQATPTQHCGNGSSSTIARSSMTSWPSGPRTVASGSGRWPVNVGEVASGEWDRPVL